jgi:hypothetical protein
MITESYHCILSFIFASSESIFAFPQSCSNLSVKIAVFKVSRKVLLHVRPLLGNGLVNKFPRRQILVKQSVARLRNNR